MTINLGFYTYPPGEEILIEDFKISLVKAVSDYS
jgi:hypothetical protein